jgi:adenine-specific DNA-methyltransferase
MDGNSLSPNTERLEQLKRIFPEIFVEDKIDWEKLKITLGEDVSLANERYVLNWAGKSDAFRLMQKTTTKTLVPVLKESVNFDDTQNIFIEGDNLDVLKVLQKSYFGKVKMIYIDPPYNTGNDSFIYADRFAETKTEYQKRVGDKDEEGYMTGEGVFRRNSRENGQYHSNWLNMMMPRLFLARNLLRDDGVIFVSIDDNEVHNLRLLMNEIFGEENFVANIVWQKKYAATNDSKGFSTTHDYIIVYQKSGLFSRNLLPRTEEQNRPYKNDDNDGKGLWRSDNLLVKSFSESGVYPIENPNTGKEYYPPKGSCWRASQETMKIWLAENRIFFGKDGKGAPQLKRYLSEVQKGSVPITWWPFQEVGHNDEANKEVAALFGAKTPFDTPKPVRLLKRMLLIGSDKDSLILDFFAGSATTAHAVMQRNLDEVMQQNKEDGGNRRYILVQIPELCNEKSEAFKAGYNTIADIAKERIRRARQKIHEQMEEENRKRKMQLDFNDGKNKPINIDTGFKVFRLAESNFKQWRQPENYSAEALAKQLELFVDPVAEHVTLQNMVYELILKSGKDLNVNIESCNGYHIIDGNELALILEKVDEQIITEVLSKQPKKVIALDRIFKGNDQLKTNTALQMKDAGMEFKTI